MDGLKAEIKHTVLDGYEVVSYYSYDDEAYVASIPSLVGCAVDAEGREEAFSLLAEAKRDWTERVSAAGHPVPAAHFGAARPVAFA